MTIKSLIDFNKKHKLKTLGQWGRQKEERNGNMHHKCKYV